MLERVKDFKCMILIDSMTIDVEAVERIRSQPTETEDGIPYE